MSEILKVIRSLSGECDCSICHETAIRDIRIGSGLVSSVGKILKENGFPKNILLVADKNTLKAADGIIQRTWWMLFPPKRSASGGMI